MITNFDKFLNENKEIKINIKSGVNQIVSAYRGSDYEPSEWRIKSGGQYGMGIYFSSSISKASSYGDLYLGEVELINPMLAHDIISFEQIKDIFYKPVRKNMFEKRKYDEFRKYEKYCNDHMFFEESRSWREIGEDIGRCTNLKYRNILFKQLSNFTNSICVDDGFEICLLNKKNILKIKKI